MKNQPKSFEILPEIAKISTRSGEISWGSSQELNQIQRNLTGSSQKISQNSPDLSNNARIFVGRLDRIYQILKKENRRQTRQSQVLKEAIHRRPSKKSIRSAAGRVRSAESSGSSPSVNWTTLQGPIVVFEKHYYSLSKNKINK